MARENEMQEFTRSLFRGHPDLSTLTHSTVLQKFLAHVGRNHLEPEEKQELKQLVDKELLKIGVGETGTRQEKLGLTKKMKRASAPCRERKRKRFCLNSDSERGESTLFHMETEPVLTLSPSYSTASSPDCAGCPAKSDKMAAAVGPTEEAEDGARQAAKKALESSDDEQMDQPAKMGSEESSEEEGSVRTSKICKEKDSEEDEEKEDKSRTTENPGTKMKQTPGKALVRKQQARGESSDSEEGPVQRTAKKVGGSREDKSHEESEQESEDDECPTERENKGEEEEEERKPRARSDRKERSSSKGRSCEEEKEAPDSGGQSGGKQSPGYRRSEDMTQKGVTRQSGSSEDGEGSRKAPTAQGSTETAELGIVSGEESDLERDVSDSEAGGSPRGERKSRSSKKSSKKGRNVSSSSSDGSPELKGRKAGSSRHGEDHPAVTRLKRYIRACGAYRNYKKLLGSCRSHKERLSVLRAELEALGMKGNPSLEKCRALKEQREEAAEVASLDVANIISSTGRPRRRTAWNPSGEAAPPGKLYRQTLDSEEEQQPRQAPPDWSHMRGIISSDGESN
ncbi:HIRA-interacting protein 3 [Ctenodactylus gundi]